MGTNNPDELDDEMAGAIDLNDVDWASSDVDGGINDGGSEAEANAVASAAAELMNPTSLAAVAASVSAGGAGGSAGSIAGNGQVSVSAVETGLPPGFGQPGFGTTGAAVSSPVGGAGSAIAAPAAIAATPSSASTVNVASAPSTTRAPSAPRATTVASSAPASSAARTYTGGISSSSARLPVNTSGRMTRGSRAQRTCPFPLKACSACKKGKATALQCRLDR